MQLRQMVGCCLLLIFTACQNSSSEQPSEPPVEEQKVDPTFTQVVEHLPQQPQLPYEINEMGLRLIEHRNYHQVEADSVEDLLPTFNSEAKYYLVAMPVEKDNFSAMVWLESELDTLFNARETFYLVTYDPLGKKLADMIFAASISEDHTYKTTGTLYADLRIHTEKYEYEFKNGSWLKISEPVKVIDYQIDPNGMIREVDSEINTDTEDDSSDMMSEVDEDGKEAA